MTAKFACKGLKVGRVSAFPRWEIFVTAGRNKPLRRGVSLSQHLRRRLHLLCGAMARAANSTRLSPSHFCGGFSLALPVTMCRLTLMNHFPFGLTVAN